MNIVKIYRISDNSNPEKVKPSYASKENCLRNFVREFGNDNLVVMCDNVTNETHEMVKKYAIEENIYLTNNGNTGAFLTSWNMAYSLSNNIPEDTIFYFVEDDYIHRRGSKKILIEAFIDLNSSYVTLYDHPDKYQNTKDSRFQWGHGKIDQDIDGIRKPGIIYNVPSACELYISKSVHWRTVSSTTMTFATTAKNIKEDYQEMVDLHTGKTLPMGGDTFRLLAAKGKQLISCLPAYSGHGEERWLPYFINWEEEAK